MINHIPIITNILGESQLPLYLGWVGVDYWYVPIIIGERENDWRSAGAQLLHKLSQYGSWIGNWGTAGDALRCVHV